jgi:hypothetical protein
MLFNVNIVRFKKISYKIKSKLKDKFIFMKKSIKI